MAQNTDFILELLQENGMVTEEQVSEGWKKVAEQDGQINIIDALKQLKYVDEFEMISMLAQQYGLEVLDLSTYRIPPEVIETVPREIVQQYKIVPVMKHDDVLTIAMSDPTDMSTLDSIRFLLKCDVDAVISPMDQIKMIMEKYYSTQEAAVNAFIEEMGEMEAVEQAAQEAAEEGGANEDDARVKNKHHARRPRRTGKKSLGMAFGVVHLQPMRVADDACEHQDQAYAAHVVHHAAMHEDDLGA